MRWIGTGGDAGRYPAALVALRRAQASGVYAIRDRESWEVLYVGESHTDRLYHTLTRHLQGWRRRKGSPRFSGGGDNDPGVTYGRGDVQIAWRVTQADKALAAEARWIRRLNPRDNLRGADDDDDRPRRRLAAGPLDGLDLPF